MLSLIIWKMVPLDVMKAGLQDQERIILSLIIEKAVQYWEVLVESGSFYTGLGLLPYIKNSCRQVLYLLTHKI